MRPRNSEEDQTDLMTDRKDISSKSDPHEEGFRRLTHDDVEKQNKEVVQLLAVGLIAPSELP